MKNGVIMGDGRDADGRRADVTEPFSALIAQNRFTNLLAPEDEWAKMNKRGQQHRKGFDVLMANGASKKPKRRQHVI